MKDNRCKYCGGFINMKTMQCEYCGTQYVTDLSEPNNFLVVNKGIQRIRSETAVSRELEKFLRDSDGLERAVQNKLVENFIPYIKDAMRWHAVFNPKGNFTTYYAGLDLVLNGGDRNDFT